MFNNEVIMKFEITDHYVYVSLCLVTSRYYTKASNELNIKIKLN